MIINKSSVLVKVMVVSVKVPASRYSVVFFGSARLFSLFSLMINAEYTIIYMYQSFTIHTIQ